MFSGVTKCLDQTILPCISEWCCCCDHYKFMSNLNIPVVLIIYTSTYYFTKPPRTTNLPAASYCKLPSILVQIYQLLSFHFFSYLRPIFSPRHVLIPTPLIIKQTKPFFYFFFSRSLHQFITLLEPPELPPSRRLLYARWL